MGDLGRDEPPELSSGRLTRLVVVVAALAVLGSALVVVPLGVILGPPDWRTVDVPLKYWPRAERPVPITTETPPADAPGDVFASPSGTPSHADAAAATRGAVAAGEGSPPSPRALEDTSVDGELVAGGDGHFQPTAAAIRLFRYFMTANGEWRRDRVRAAIQGEIDTRLAPPANAEARAFLEQYFRYLDASRSLDPAGLDARDLAGRLEQVRDLQRAIFGDDLAEKLFGPENDQAEAALERLVNRLAPERAASAGDRGDASSADGADPGGSSSGRTPLPPAIQAARERATAPLAAARKVDELRAAGASAADVRAERVRRFGEEAAARLDDLDQERSEWDARIAAYRVARDAILGDPNLDAARRVDALDRLREERFSGDEIRHVAELDRLDALLPTLPPR